jgi:hypothetical protein
MRRLLAVVSLFAFAGCHEDNLLSCERPGNVGKGVCPDAPTIGGPCMTDNDCAATAALGLAFCDRMRSPAVCVQCTVNEHAVCTNTTPVCTNDVCAGCTKHMDCPDSLACMPDGSCASAANVAYVDGDHGVDNAPCTKDMPCTKIDKATGIKQIVKVTGTVTDRASIGDRVATIVADVGAKLAPRAGDNGIALEVKGASKIAIYDLQISNANNGPGISTADTATLALTGVTVRDNAGNGITITGTSHLTCTRCLLAGNALRGIDASGGAGRLTISQSTISDNSSGGIRMQDDSSFQIVSNIIFRNGQPNPRAAAGGIFISVNAPPIDAPPNRIDFNSLSANIGLDAGQGIQCTAATPLTASNNIISDNGLAPAAVAQVFGPGCSYAYSDIGPMGLGTANGNLSVPPAFDTQSGKPLRLSTTSPVRHLADPSADLRGLAALDIDGDMRVGPRADIGADQVP